VFGNEHVEDRAGRSKLPTRNLGGISHVFMTTYGVESCFHIITRGVPVMSWGEPEPGAEIERLRLEIQYLNEQQQTSQRIAAVVGMTAEESQAYRERHSRIRKLERQLSEMDGLRNGATSKEAGDD
jgi:hypothetical protein